MGKWKKKPKNIIVFDGQLPPQNRYCGIPIREVSQIDIKNKKMKIIVTLNKINTESVKKAWVMKVIYYIYGKGAIMN